MISLNSERPLFVIVDGQDIDAIFDIEVDGFDAAIPIVRLSASPAGMTQTLNIESRAMKTVEMIRRMQPTGPYRLAGYFQGSLVAYETAFLLVGHEQAVDFVGLIGEWVRCGDYEPQQAASIQVDLFAGFERASDGTSEVRDWRALLSASQFRQVAFPREQPFAINREVVRMLTEAATKASERAYEIPEMLYNPAVVIQAGQHGHTPLFCIPGAGGTVAGYVGLAAALGRDWPIYGLQPRGLESSLIPHSSVEAAADKYLQAIEESQPRGAIHLLGHSFGGWVAFEIARKICAGNREIASLTLVDSDAPGRRLIASQHTALSLVEEYIEMLELAAEQPLGIEREPLESANQAKRLAMIHSEMVRLGLLSARTRSSVLEGSMRTFSSALRTAYQPQGEYPGPTRLVVVPDIRLDFHTNEKLNSQKISNWQSLAPRLSYWEGPGNHLTILQPPAVWELAKWWLAGSESLG